MWVGWGEVSSDNYLSTLPRDGQPDTDTGANQNQLATAADKYTRRLSDGLDTRDVSTALAWVDQIGMFEFHFTENTLQNKSTK